MITLKNAYLTAEISELGAELKSLKCNETEYIWNGDPKYWKASCPILFPICSGLKDGKFTFDGKEYSLQKHGYARFKTFDVESADDTRAVFLHKSDDETRAQYPFDYELRVIFTLEGKSLKIDYAVKNTGKGNMYFNIGGHEGYATPEGIEEYEIIFDKKIDLNASELEENLLSDKTVSIIKNSDKLQLSKEYFAVDALIFRNIGSRSATLRHKNSGRAIRVDYPDAEHLLLWQVCGAPYICIEPWDGLPDVVGCDGNIAHKESVKALVEGGEYIFSHTLSVL